MNGADPRTLNRQIHGLRGVSAVAVFVYHVCGMGVLWGFWPDNLIPAEPFFAAGKHGVEIFFLISGYLITGSLIRHQDAGRFLIDRCIRLYPVFMTIQVLVFTIGPVIHYKFLAGISPGEWATAFISNALFLPGIFPLPLAQLNAWSLSFEAAFYLLSAGLFMVFRTAGRWAALAVLTLILIPILWTFPKTIFFLVGAIILAIDARRAPAIVMALSLPALIATLAVLTLSETRPILILAAAMPAFGFFWSIVGGRCWLSAILRTPFLQYLGTISYSFYLWSPVVTFPMKLLIQARLKTRLTDLIIVILFAGIGLAASVAVAHVSHRFLEVRAGTALRRRFASRRGGGVPAERNSVQG